MIPSARPRVIRVVLALIGTALLAVAAGCGDDDSRSSAGSQNGPGNGVDLAFVSDMIPHHEGAVEMARVAVERGDSDFVKELGNTIARTQAQEIEELKDLKRTLGNAGVEPTAMSHQMGTESDASMLRTAEPFDQAFIDMMVPHHRDAILMAREVLQKGENADVRKLAEAIISAQSTEIEEMNKFREESYGAPSPAGGVPPDGESGGGHSGM